MIDCKDKGCELKGSSGYYIVRAEIEPLQLKGYYCTYCHGFWPLDNTEEIDPKVGLSARQILKSAGLDPDLHDYKIEILDQEYLEIIGLS